MGIFQRAKQRIGAAFAAPPQVGATSTGVRTKSERLSKKKQLKEYNNIAKDVHQILRNNPETTDDELMYVLNLEATSNTEAAVATGRRAYEKENLLKPKRKYQQDPKTGPQQQKQGEPLVLVNYTPEQQVQQVEQTLSTIHFGMSITRMFKERLSEFWSVAAPIVLFTGTVGEVYFFIYNNMTKAGQSPEWWVSLSILATVIALEFSFMVVSMKSDTIRNDMRAHGGGTPLEKKDMRNHLISWFVLAVGVSIGQVSFLVVSMTGGINNVPFLIAFSIGRSVFTLAADFYVAFVHKEMPTTSDQAQMRLESRAKASKMLLEQKGEETAIINDGILRVREATTEAEIKHDKMITRLKVEKIQNKAQVDLLEAQAIQSQLFSRMGQSFMQSLFDPDMNPEKRQTMLHTMSTLADAMKQLPSPKTVITEEPDTGDL